MNGRHLLNGLLVACFVLAATLGLSGCGYIIDRFTTPAAGMVTQYGKGYRFDHNGWVYLHIKGDPHERGVKYLTYWETGKEWAFFVAAAEQQFAGKLDPEYLDEIKGIADGAKAAGVNITWQEVLAWDGYEELTGYWWPNDLAGKYA